MLFRSIIRVFVFLPFYKVRLACLSVTFHLLKCITDCSSLRRETSVSGHDETIDGATTV